MGMMFTDSVYDDVEVFPMLMYVESSIWQSPAQTLVNTVNTVGVMGKGIALQFKQQFPDMYIKYRELCKAGKFDVGNLWLYKGSGRNVLNFPTKQDWRRPSKVEYIVDGLEKFLRVYEAFNISSISFPQLGTGHGGLDWDEEVQPVMEKYLRHIPIPVYVHLVRRDQNFLPEYLLPVTKAIPFEQLLSDIQEFSGAAFHLRGSSEMAKFCGIKEDYLEFERTSECVHVPLEYLRMVWGDLNSKGIVKNIEIPSRSVEYFAFLTPLLDRIDYVQVVNVSHDSLALRTKPETGLMLATTKSNLNRPDPNGLALL